MDVPAPVNDECANQISLTLQTVDNPTYTDCSIGGATESTSACNGSVSTDVWFSFTANSKANYIYLPSQYNLNLAFEILDACDGNSIACINNNAINYSESYYNNNFIIGETYYIKVFLYNQSFATGTFEIAVIDVPAPINDDCENSQEITVQGAGNPVSIIGNIGGATESITACNGNIATDVWFNFTATSTNQQIFIDATYDFDPALEIFDACNGNSIACVDNNSMNYAESYYSTEFIQGNNYMIRVFGYQQKIYNLEFGITVIDSSITTSVNNIDKRSIELYPNPASGYLTVKIEDQLNNNIQIVSVTGIVCLEQNIKNTAILNVSFLKKGVYFVKCINENKQQIIKRLIIE